MATAELIVKKEVTLQLTEEEAEFILGMVQNPIGCTPEEEPDDTNKIRGSIFYALRDLLWRK